MISRREVLIAGTAASVGTILSTRSDATDARKGFRFVHFCDPHIEPELGAPVGVRMAVERLRGLHPRPDFVITGGDHVMDVLDASKARADVQFELLKEALKPLEVPMHGVIGNHDVFGWGRTDASQNDPEYGKRMLAERFLGTPLYRSFEFGGWHFALLDTIQPSPKTVWHGLVDDAQLTWLDNDLAAAGSKPKVIVSHFPVLTLFTQYTDGTLAVPEDTLILANGKDVQQLCHKHGVKVVLQAHTHVVEDCEYLGTHYVTGGAVCGDWWKGWRLGVHPEGFMVYDVSADEIKGTYVTYGWRARTS